MWWICVGLGAFAAAVHWLIRERPVARLALAEAYRDAGRRDESHRLLLEILRMPVLPARARSHHATQEKARQLLSK